MSITAATQTSFGICLGVSESRCVEVVNSSEVTFNQITSAPHFRISAVLMASVVWTMLMGEFTLVSGQSVLPAARADLQAVPLPPLESLEAAVADQLGDARQQFERVAANSGSSRRRLADAYGALGEVYHAYELFETAEAAYVNATRLVPDEGKWLHLLGCLYQQTGRLEDAADRFVAARRIQPDNHAAAVRLGEVYMRLNRLKEAREQFERVMEIYPALSRNGLGEIALREGRFEDAIAHLNAALQRVPQATSIHYSLAMAYRGLGRLDEARAHLQQRGANGITLGDPLFDGLPRLVRGERGLVVQGRRAYEAGQFREAAEAFGKALEAAPDSVTARANLGLALLRLGKPAEAVQQFESTLRLEPANFVAHAGLGILLADEGRYADAIGHLQAAFEQAPDDANVTRAFLRSLVRLKLHDEAIAVLERARSSAPDDEDTLVGLSFLLADRGRFREAVALLDDSNRQFPDRTMTATTLARLLASSPDVAVRDGSRALELAHAVYASKPGPEHAETVALALAELGRCDEALEWIRRAISEAERAKDAAETARLKSELPRYESNACRAPGN